jgi:hypothetical protein
MRTSVVACAALLFAGVAGNRAAAQVQYATGQDVAPVFEGWEQNPDGTYSLVFGYLNRNYAEEVDIPVGAANSITIGDESYGDRGQPTHFYPRRQRFLFKVVVPKDWDKKQKVVWTLTSRGHTDQAKGWLQPEWELSDDVIIENMGGGVPDPANQAPKIEAIKSPVTIPVQIALALTVKATDDGLPKPYRRAPSNPDRDAQPRRPRGVQIKWKVYRAAGKVTFEPDSSPVVYGEPVELASKVRFSAPGEYVLRVTADDGQRFTTQDVKVTAIGDLPAACDPKTLKGCVR